jgi:hypothetical protein
LARVGAGWRGLARVGAGWRGLRGGSPLPSNEKAGVWVG